MSNKPPTPLQIARLREVGRGMVGIFADGSRYGNAQTLNRSQVEALVKRGWVKRVPGLTDNETGDHYVLTEAGKDALR